MERFDDYSPSTDSLQYISIYQMGNADDKFNKLIGAVLKEFRNQAGISQQELALDCGLDRTYISLLERGLRQPTIRTVFVLSKALDIKPSKFISKIEDSV